MYSSIIAFIHQLIHISTSIHPFNNPSIHPFVCSIVHPSIPPILSLISLYLSATISYLPIHLTYVLSAYLPMSSLPIYLCSHCLSTCLLANVPADQSANPPYLPVYLPITNLHHTHLTYLPIYLSYVPIYSHQTGVRRSRQTNSTIVV